MYSRRSISSAKTNLAAWPSAAKGVFPKRGRGGGTTGERRKRARTVVKGMDFFKGLSDDLVLLVLSKLSASAESPADIINVFLTCGRFNSLGMHPAVLSKLSPKGTALRAGKWCDAAHRFLKRCSDAGSLEASYTLGMINFYCLENRGSGVSLMAKAAMVSHAPALYSLAVIQFNGSGGSKNDKDLRAGVALCARAAYFGHVDALRELGHCLQDGYGVRQNVTEGRRFLVQANARELTSVLSASSSAMATSAATMLIENRGFSSCSLLSDFGCNVPVLESHPANRFMVEWFASRGGPPGVAGGEGGDGLRMCSHVGCGRPETRRHEFRRCSVCGTVNYCSRACQALDWKLSHKARCAPMDQLHNHAVAQDGQAFPPAEVEVEMVDRAAEHHRL
ncbi:hypothetical protein HPP92_004144 [Vanilla planifolia]|uniref:MYND-type domain-containing protein n=1 Tax=Vanilla planifolia TaxID=51239 RepID=A0A835S3X6_VANPL|nr:hypothetical protein HPP92_004581 [Vanilla planifolia]KAG0504072.1 hypothetical protein HPP92_004144 [Vanilla planifolia]